MERPQELTFDVNSEIPLSRTNEFLITANWKDKNGEELEKKKDFVVMVEAESFSDQIKMLINWAKGLFS